MALATNDTSLTIISMAESELTLTPKEKYKEYMKEDEVHGRRAERKQQDARSTKNEMYQLLGFYFVFQGVLLTAISQQDYTKIKCRFSWIPMILSFIASCAAFYGLDSKLYEQEIIDNEIKYEKSQQHAIIDWIDKFKGKHAGFNPLTDEPVQRGGHPLTCVPVPVPELETEQGERDPLICEPEHSEGDPLPSEPEQREGGPLTSEPELRAGDPLPSQPEQREGVPLTSEPEQREGVPLICQPEQHEGEGKRNEHHQYRKKKKTWFLCFLLFLFAGLVFAQCTSIVCLHH